MAARHAVEAAVKLPVHVGVAEVEQRICPIRHFLVDSHVGEAARQAVVEAALDRAVVPLGLRRAAVGLEQLARRASAAARR